MSLAETHILPDDLLIGELLRQTARRLPGRVAIRTEAEALSFAELDARADRCAAAVGAACAQTGTRVGIVMVLDPVFAAAFYGASRSGNVIVTVNPMLREAALEHIFRTAGIEIAFVTAAVAQRLAAVRERLPLLRTLVLLDAGPVPETVSYQDFLAAAPADPPAPELDPAGLACIQFTSGTTGAPKGVMLSHRNITVNAVQVAVAHGLDENSVTVNHIPGYHLMHLNSALYAGATQVLCRDLDPTAPFALANEYRADLLYGLPVLLARLAVDPRLRELRLDTVQAIHSGGSALPSGTAATLSRHFGTTVLQGYGLAETSPLTHCDRVDRPKRDSVGYPVTGTECRVVHIESRIPLPPGGKGEVQVRGPQLMMGYLGEPDPPEIDGDGWFSTADVGYIDRQGTLFLVDRIKDVFKCDNELVAPTEIERVLITHPSVADCAVIEHPDPFSGHVPHGLVVLRKDAARPVAVEDIADFVNERVAPFQRLRAIEETERIPRTPTGKIERRAIRAEITARVPH